MNQKLRLTSLILASSFFVRPIFATTVPGNYPEPTTNPQLQTTSGSVQITSSGHVTTESSVDGVIINSPTGIVTLDANNSTAGNNAIDTTANAGLNGIHVTAGGGANSGASITVGTATGILATNKNGILIEDATATINNSGKIVGGQSGVNIAVGGTTATLTNNAGATITGTSAPTILVGDTGFMLTNNGQILTTSTQDAIQLNKNFSTITNFNLINSDGITPGKGNGINLNGTAITGDINNTGTIITSGANSAGIVITGAYAGTINNNAGGVIQTSTVVSGSGAALWINNTFNVVNNAGSITSGTQNPAVRIDGAMTNGGTINNSGTIQGSSAAIAPVFISSPITQFNNNSGATIATTVSGFTAVSAVGTKISNGFTNSGTITAPGVAGTAINFAGSQITLTQNDGTITGQVLLADKASDGTGNVFFMNGGATSKINGALTAQSIQSNTLELNGGAISGITTLGDMGDTINLYGTAVQAVQGGLANDIFNLKGASTFTLLDGAGGANNILNIVGSYNYTTGSLLNIQTLNVTNPGTTFTVSKTIPAGFGIANLNIAANTQLVANENVTVTAFPGAITNNGSISVAPTKVVTSNTYTQNPAAYYAAEIPFDPTTVGYIKTNTNTNISGFINPILVTDSFVPEGSNYDILRAVGGFTDTSTVSTQNSPVVYFTKTNVAGLNGTCPAGNNCIRLTSHRNPYAVVGTSDVAIAVGATLDGIVPLFPNINSDILTVLGAIDRLSTVQQVNAALESLAPGFNYALAMSSHVSMNNAFDSVQVRIEDLRGLGPANQEDAILRRDEELYNGVNYGDISDIYGGTGTGGIWVKINEDYISQAMRNNIIGYQINNTGLAIGGDYRVNDTLVVGVAGSYNKSNTYDYSQARNTIDNTSYQLTFYTWLQPYGSLYIDGMLGICSNQYSTVRNIAIANISAIGDFYGLQYGAQVDVGYAFLNSDDFFVAPFGRLKFTYLDIDRYTESGAGGISLAVTNDDLDEAIAGVGIRFGVRKDYVEAIYVPEISAMVLYDFSGEPQEMQSSFLGGGNPFYISSISPAQMIYLLSLGINAHTSDHYTATLKYNLEMRDHFYGNNLYLQIHYTFN